MILVNNQLDARFSMYLFISLLYMFQATQAYQAVTYTEWYIPDDVLIQFDPPDDEHCVARNM
jgi:hypothetical protein